MKVYFSAHCVVRMKERLNIDVNSYQEYDLVRLNFVQSHTYTNTSDAKNFGKINIAFVFRDKSQPIVLCVDPQTRKIGTVYIGQKLSNRNAPFVDLCYEKARI